MPTYCYTVWKGRSRVQTVERVFPLGKAPESVVLEDGAVAVLDVAAQAATSGMSGDWQRPIYSHGAGFNPMQRDEALAAAARDHVPLELAPDGAAIFHNRQQRNAVLDWRGMHDNDGGYGDR